MREHPKNATGEGADQPALSARDGAGGPRISEPALKLASNITAAEAIAVFQRKLPGSHVEVREALHPFWWTALNAGTKGIFNRSRPGSLSRGAAGAGPGPGQRMNVLVNAYSGKGFIADFEPRGIAVEAAEWNAALESSDQAGPTPSLFEVSRTARSLVRTKVVKTVKLGMGITLEEVGPPRGIFKPNWVVSGANKKFSATILVDGLDSSHYIVRVEKLAQG